MRVAVTYPTDPEKALREILTDLFSDEIDGGLVTVGIGVPSDWKITGPPSPTHIQVEWNTTPRTLQSVAIWATVRVIIHAVDVPTAKQVALKAYGLLEGDIDHPGVSSVYPSTGPLPAIDPQSLAQIVGFNTQVCVRAVNIDTGS